MQVLLKIVGGKHAGREIKITSPEFIIGRGEGAHLKPASEMVSRKHCSIKIQDGKAIVADMGSRNGSFLNDAKLTKPTVAKNGDRLRVGRLEFEFVLDPVKSAKNPKVKDVVDAASRTASTAKSVKKSSIEDSISDWLVDEDDDSPFDDPDFDASETVQFSLEETREFVRNSEEEVAEKEVAEKEEVKATDAKAKRIDKKKKGKLPPRPKKSHGDSTDAADDILKKLLNRR